MKQNVGTLDKIIRIIISIVFLVLGYFISFWFYIGTIIFAGTAFFGFCSIYKLFKISTVEKEKSQKNNKNNKK
jgi:phosphotransferase system  glucose/maltose/N-acetylglucosamine-specific IIC component